MGLLTYQVKFADKVISVKAKKETAKKFSHSLNNLLRINSFTRELGGIIGVTEGWGKEHSSVCMCLGLPSGVPLPDPDGYAKELEAFKAEIPSALADDKTGSLGVWLVKAEMLLNKHMPVVDNRKTPEQAAADKEEMKRRNDEREAERIKKTQEDNAKASEILKQFPYLTPSKDMPNKNRYAVGSANLKTELNRAYPTVDFSVKSEGFSMGNAIRVRWTDGPTVEQVKKISDKYQQGSFDGMTDIYDYNHDQFHEVFGGAKYVDEGRKASASLMIEVAAGMGHTFTPEQWQEFDQTAHQYPESLELLRGIRMQAENTPKLPLTPSTPAPEPVSDGNVTVRMNRELNGVEILFRAKPDQETIVGLKSHGFRWSPKGKLWYAKQNDSRIMFAHSLQGPEQAEEVTDILTDEQDREGAEFYPTEQERVA